MNNGPEMKNDLKRYNDLEMKNGSGTKNDLEIERVVAVDWSGDKGLGQRKKIWAGVWTGKRGGPVYDGQVRLEGGRSREELCDWLIAMAQESPRMVVGFDFCFGFPEWFVRGELGCASGPEFWALVAAGHGERWLSAECADRRFWGRPHKRPAEFSGEHLPRMMRAADVFCKLVEHIPEAERAARVKGITPKSVFQIGGSGSVGTASLRGMPVLLRLRAAGFSVWPFDRPALADSRPMVVEMYSRLNTGPVHKSNPVARAAYLTSRRAEDTAYASLPRAVLAKARASEDAFDALISCMVMTRQRAEFARLQPPADPKAHVEGWTWAPGPGQAAPSF